MEPGSIVEFIDRQKIICAVVLDVKKLRLRLLTENNREVNISATRLSHKKSVRLDLSMGRDKLVDALKRTASRRKALINDIDIRELWEVLNTEQEWIDLPTMTQFCFPDNSTFDHEAAVIRAFFNDKQYFKFNPDRFFPNPEEQVDKAKTQAKEAERKNKIIEAGGSWLKNILNGKLSSVSKEHADFVAILKSFYLFENDSPHYTIAKAMLEKAGIKNNSSVFQALVKVSEWDENENLDLYRYDIHKTFSSETIEAADEVIRTGPKISIEAERKNLTGLPVMTIDGQATLDFDDALSIQEDNGHYLIGVHIADVGHFIRKGNIIDLEAKARASSIYTPDRKISMIPSSLAEDLCSLKAGQDRPAVSIMARIKSSGEIIDYEIFPSIVQVKQQLTYFDVNLMAGEHREIGILHDIAKKFQQKRLEQGAVQISLPEINIWFDDEGNLNITRTNRESPGRLLVAELMIMANWLMARFLSERGLPAIYRSQSGPRERLYKKNEGTLFQNWSQRKLLSRLVLNPEPEHHSGLGLGVYVTGSSPIRKYFDLATQRQIRSAFGFETPYTREEIQHIIQILGEPMSAVGRVQYQRNRYWLLKYLEGKIGQKEEAIVIAARKNNCTVLLPEYMMESTMPLSMGIELKPQSVIQVTIQHVDARRDLLTVFLS